MVSLILRFIDFDPKKIDEDKNEYPEYQLDVNYDRASWIRRREINKWPPTMDELLEYITIYSQMNNFKFANLNKDKVNQASGKKKQIKKRVKNARASTQIRDVTQLESEQDDNCEISKSVSMVWFLKFSFYHNFRELESLKISNSKITK